MRILVFLCGISSGLGLIVRGTQDPGSSTAAERETKFSTIIPQARLNARGDRFCNNGIKAPYTGDTNLTAESCNSTAVTTCKFFCCPAECAGQCIANKTHCDEVKNRTGGSFDDNCCIANHVANPKSCYNSSGPCELEFEWTGEERRLFNLYKRDLLTAEDSVKDYYSVANENPLEQARRDIGKMDVDTQQFNNSVSRTVAQFGSATDHWQFNARLDSCDAVWKKIEDIEDYIAVIEHASLESDKLHSDHGYGAKKKISKGTFRDYFYAVGMDAKKALLKKTIGCAEGDASGCSPKGHCNQVSGSGLSTAEQKQHCACMCGEVTNATTTTPKTSANCGDLNTLSLLQV